MNTFRLSILPHSRPLCPSLKRFYAVRPLPRPKDPLATSKNAVVTELAPGLTFIHRPPPTASSPHSLTTAPASPLLWNSSSVASSSSLLRSSTSNAESSLPPMLGSGPPPKLSHVTPEQVQEMRALRESDPSTYTVSVLAKKYECSSAFVNINAPLSKEERRKIDVQNEEQRASWGNRKRLSRDIRQKRKELW